MQSRHVAAMGVCFRYAFIAFAAAADAAALSLPRLF